MDQDLTWFGGLAAIVGIAVCVFWFGPTALGYSLEYRVLPTKVHVDPEPRNCGFWHVPVGFKGCRYEAKVYQAQGSIFVSWVEESD